MHPHPEGGRLSLAGSPACSSPGLPPGAGLRLSARQRQTGSAVGAVCFTRHARTESPATTTGVSLPTL